MSKEIQLTRGKVAIVDDEDFERLNQHNWCVRQGTKTFYAIREAQGKRIHMHHLICPKPVDHINGNGLDNRRCNLRQATQSQNRMNQSKGGGTSSKFKGVTWSKQSQKWQAQIKFHKKNKHLGLFISEVEAAKAYDKAAKQLFGTFAKPNFSD